MNKNIFQPADILLPKDTDMEKWAVIACDQFTSDQAYWDRVRAKAGNSPSTIRLILPEAELGSAGEAEQIAKINRTMRDYLEQGVFALYPNSYVYVERTLENGSIRQGLIGKIDLEAMTTTRAPCPASGPRRRPCPSASRPASGSGGTRPSSCPMCCCSATTMKRS